MKIKVSWKLKTKPEIFPEWHRLYRMQRKSESRWINKIRCGIYLYRLKFFFLMGCIYKYCFLILKFGSINFSIMSLIIICCLVTRYHFNILSSFLLMHKEMNFCDSFLLTYYFLCPCLLSIAPLSPTLPVVLFLCKSSSSFCFHVTYNPTPSFVIPSPSL